MEENMAEGSGSSSFLGFILGGVVVVLAILAFVVYGGGNFGGTKTVTLNLPAPTAPAR
jgi:hypothetical protein